jgi:hypothetical protein
MTVRLQINDKPQLLCGRKKRPRGAGAVAGTMVVFGQVPMMPPSSLVITTVAERG